MAIRLINRKKRRRKTRLINVKKMEKMTKLTLPSRLPGRRNEVLSPHPPNPLTPLSLRPLNQSFRVLLASPAPHRQDPSRLFSTLINHEPYSGLYTIPE